MTCDQILALMGLCCSYGVVGLCVKEVFSFELYREWEWFSCSCSSAAFPTVLIAVPSAVMATIATVLLFRSAAQYSEASILRTSVKMFRSTAILALLPPALCLMVVIYSGLWFGPFMFLLVFFPLFVMVIGGCIIMGPIMVLLHIQVLMLLASDFDPKSLMLTMEALLFWITAQRLTFALIDDEQAKVS